MSKSGESTRSVLTQPMSEHRRCFLQIVLVVRSEVSGYFGEHFADHWGFFTDRHMCSEIHRFADWIDYPKGDRVLKKHSSKVLSAVVSSDGRFLFAGLYDGFISMMDLLKNEEIWLRKAHSNEVRSLAHHSCGLLCSGTRNGDISLWNVFDESKLVHRLTGHMRGVSSPTFNRKATQIVSGSLDSSVRLWSVKTGECLRELEGHSGSVHSALFIGDFIVSGSADKTIRVWNIDDGECVRVIKDFTDKPITRVCLNSDGSLMVALYHRGFTLFSWPEMRVLRTSFKSTFHGQFHPSHPHLLAVSYQKARLVKIYNVMSEECVRTLEGHSKNAEQVCFTPDGCRLLSVSRDRTTRVWDLSDLLFIA